MAWPPSGTISGGLELFCQTSFIRSITRKNNLNIDVHDGISPEPPKVITRPILIFI